MNKVDVIIPTIMETKLEVFGYLLIQLNECPYVHNIIVIDNTKDQSFKSKLGIVAHKIISPHLKVINGHKHGYLVNASWNRGMRDVIHEQVQAPYYCLLNDDIILNKHVIECAMRVFSCHHELSLLTVATVNNIPIEQYLKEYDKGPERLSYTIPNGRQGWIMFGLKRQWKMIPDNIKLFYGDDWIYRNASKHGTIAMLMHPMVSHFQSTSVNRNMDKLKPIIEQDAIEWQKLCSTHQV